MKSFKQGASSLRVKNQVQSDQYGNRLVVITVPNYLPQRPKNVNIYDELLIIDNVLKTKNYVPFLPRSSSKVLGDSYLTNITPFNKPFRYDYKFLVNFFRFD